MAQATKPQQLDVTKPDQEQISPTPTSTSEEKPKIVISNKGPAQLTFPELLGSVVAKVLADHTAMNQAKSDITVWFAAQDPETQVELVRKTRSELEYSRGIIESAYQHFRELSFQVQ